MPATTWTEGSITANTGWEENVPAFAAGTVLILLDVPIQQASFSDPGAASWTEASASASSWSEGSVGATTWTEAGS